MTLKEIKEQYANELDNGAFANWVVFRNYNDIEDEDLEIIAERYAQSKTQELQEQNAELVANIKLLLQSLDYDALGVMSGLIIEDLKELLTKYNHLKSNTNG